MNDNLYNMYVGHSYAGSISISKHYVFMLIAVHALLDVIYACIDCLFWIYLYHTEYKFF